ncbi:MAG: flagellar basal body rod protein FlgC [Rhodospirillaceae bacterium]
MDDVRQASRIAVSGLKAQSERLRTISQNLANADSVSDVPGGEPYRRKILVFQNELDRSIGADLVKVAREREDMTAFDRRYDPSHPGADAEGYYLVPNVNPMLELMDLRQAQRSYEANLNVISTSREITRRTLELLR